MRRGAQWGSPACVAANGQRHDMVEGRLDARSREHEQDQAETHEDEQQLRYAGTELNDRDILVARMIRITRPRMIVRAGAVMVRPINAVAAGSGPVHVRALRCAGIAVLVEMHVQTAQLQGEQAEARSEQGDRA